MRSRLALLVLSIAAASFVLSAQAAQLRLVSTAWSPFTNTPGQPRLALDLVEAALGRIKVTATTAIVDAAQFTPALLTGAFDGSGAAWKDAEREKVLLYSQAYLENRLILVGRKGAAVGAASLGALKGKSIAIVGGYSYGDIDRAGPVFIRSQSEEDSLTQVLQGKAEYALMDELVVQYIVSNYPKEAQTRLELGKAPLVTRPLFVAIRRTRPDAESLISRFNAQLRGMIADRTYHKLLHVDWIRADIDGDGVLEDVPKSDMAGTSAPQQVYSLTTLTKDQSQSLSRTVKLSPRFYLGGNIYTDWATVPNKFKVADPNAPDPNRSTASLFKFVW
jgi:polar amino acid transport system substrate-binding protein